MWLMKKIPEFPSRLILSLFLIVSLMALFYKSKLDVGKIIIKRNFAYALFGKNEPALFYIRLALPKQ